MLSSVSYYNSQSYDKLIIVISNSSEGLTLMSSQLLEFDLILDQVQLFIVIVHFFLIILVPDHYYN